VTPPSEPFSTTGFVIDVVPLLRWPGNRCLVDVAAEPAELATTTAVVTRLTSALVAESLAEGLSVAGQVEVRWEGDCRRCLEPTGGTFAVDLKEIYETEPVEGETYRLTDDRVDLEPMVREQVLLALPLAPLCREGCEGPAPGSFPANLTLEPDTKEDDQEAARDPRWAALDDLTFE